MKGLGDPMERLYSPWRSNYHKANHHKACIFCKIFEEQKDRENFVLKRFEHCVAMLNLYPYNAGHIMIVPFNHVNSYELLTKDQRNNVSDALAISCEKIKNALKPDGLNIGMNIGKGAGGSIPDHLHAHIVPRWQGDTSFMITICETKQVSADLNIIYDKLFSEFLNS